MVCRIQEAIDLADAGLISAAKAEREISAAENLAVALAPLAQG